MTTEQVASSISTQALEQGAWSVVGDLIAARALIENPDNWSCDGWGRDGKRCAANALDRIEGSRYPGAAYEALLVAMSSRSVGVWNDTHTHAEVLAAFDRAIEAAKHLDRCPSTEGSNRTEQCE